MSEQQPTDPLVSELRGLVRTDSRAPTGGARVAIRAGRGRLMRRVVGTAGVVAALLVGVPVALSVGGTTAAPVRLATQEPSPTVAEPSVPAAPSPAAPSPAVPVPSVTASPEPLDPAPTPTSPTAPLSGPAPVGPDDSGPATAVPVAPPQPVTSLDLPPTETPVLLEQDGSGRLYLVAARASVQDGFDRVVWEYAGEGTPEWRVGYVDDPNRQGSGDPVTLAGGATLQLIIRSVAWVPSADDPVPVPYPGPRRLLPTGTSAVQEVDVELTFEGDQQSFVGVQEELPFRVTLLREPTRVVLDIAHGAP